VNPGRSACLRLKTGGGTREEAGIATWMVNAFIGNNKEPPRKRVLPDGMNPGPLVKIPRHGSSNFILF
jgi:hypothetical protein